MNARGVRWVLVVLAVQATALAGEAWWAEGEAWRAQHGCRGADRPPFGSRGECLGSGWGGQKGHYVVYGFRLAAPLAAARLHIRYARGGPGDSRFEVVVDGRTVEARAAFKSTSGWGHLRDDEWAWRSFPLGALAAGRHELRLASLSDRNNTNLDGFFLASGAFRPPDTRAAIERAPRLAIRAAHRPITELVDRALTLEDFAPMHRDIYYSDEEVALPSPADARRQGLATVDVDGRPCTVVEVNGRTRGVVAYYGADAPAAHIAKAVGDTAAIAALAPRYPKDFVATLLKSRSDVLGRKVLRRKSDPSFEGCAGFLPDVAGYTFLSTEQSRDVLAVDTDGRIGPLHAPYGPKRIPSAWFDPRDHLPPHEPTAAKRGLVGGWLPAIDYGFHDADAKLGWEEIAFVVPSPRSVKRLVLYVYLRQSKPDGSVQRQYFCATAGKATPIAAAEFFARLLAFRNHWQVVLGDAMAVDVPEPRLDDASRASLARAFITYEGDAPCYGVGQYGHPQHDTFPPTTLSMANACIEWGLLDRARRYLDHYLDHVVKPDGTFAYYGPAVSEYGQMLDVVARFARRTGDAAWLRRQWPKAHAIASHLLALRRQSQAKHPKGSLRHGLVFGSPEADTRKQVDYYYSGDAWTWRGWAELGRVAAEMGDAAMKRRGRELLAECHAYRADVEASIARSIVRTTQPPFVPPVAGYQPPFKTMTQDRFASYTNYRYWIEMLSAGFLRPEWHDAIIAYRLEHGGELLGTTRFSGHLDDWPFAGYSYGLLLRDRVRHFLLGLYGDLALHRMHGTFTAYEQVAIADINHRPYRADYCVPAQLVTPLLVRWMLVFEEPDADVLWLCRATPRRWLAKGRRIAVRGATTRWGPVSFAVEPQADGSIRATIELPRANLPAELRLRLRTPGAKPIREVTLNGKPHADVDAEGEFVRIARPRAETLRIVVAY